MNRVDLQKKLRLITNELLCEKGYIAFVDVFMALGYLCQVDYDAWRNKRLPFLEKAIKVNLGKINFIMKTIAADSRKGKLRESITQYHSWGKKDKRKLQFSKTGDRNIEKTYATHFLKP